MKYPNLELLEYQSKKWIDELYPDRLGKYPHAEAYLFPQTWGSTALGFDDIGGFAGQAMTQAYTTVIKFTILNSDDVYCVVCFGDRLAYSVKNPNKTFYDDLNNRCMNSQRHGYSTEKMSNYAKNVHETELCTNVRYKIILDDVFPQCCGYDLSEDEAKTMVAKLRAEKPSLDFYVFTVDGDSTYW